jgi:hypothetical protein
MPDVYGFNHLGAKVACIDCGASGALWEWGEKKRAAHQRHHLREERHEAARRARANLAKARRLQRQAQRENEIAYG